MKMKMMKKIVIFYKNNKMTIKMEVINKTNNNKKIKYKKFNNNQVNYRKMNNRKVAKNMKMKYLGPIMRKHLEFRLINQLENCLKWLAK